MTVTLTVTQSVFNRPSEEFIKIKLDSIAIRLSFRNHKHSLVWLGEESRHSSFIGAMQGFATAMLTLCTFHTNLSSSHFLNFQ